VIEVADTHLEEWADCVEKGADLDELPAVQHLVTVLELDTKARARSATPHEAFIAPSPEELTRLLKIQGLAKAGVTTISHMLWVKENINYAGNASTPTRSQPWISISGTVVPCGRWRATNGPAARPFWG
jgi:hypothetical protein